MATVHLEIPPETSKKLAPYEHRLEELVLLGLQQIHIQEALLLYSRGLISLSKAAEQTSLTHEEMARQARAAGIEPRWSEEMAQDELA